MLRAVDVAETDAVSHSYFQALLFLQLGMAPMVGSTVAV
jgi:hypothetical protein